MPKTILRGLDTPMLPDVHARNKQDSNIAWQSSATELADWAMPMITMWKAHGRYRPLHQRDDRPPAYTLKRKATSQVLEDHFLGRTIIGLHAISPKNRSRWLAIDIDDHSLTGEKSAANRKAAVAWYNQLRSHGFNPLLTESSPGSFHLLIRFNCEIPSETGHRFAHWTVRDWAEYGLGCHPEVFPKQPRLNPPRLKYGNWLRLPGRHHTQEWWSRAFDGTKWLDAAGTVDHILRVEGNSQASIPQAARKFEIVRQSKKRLSQVSPAVTTASLDVDTVALLADLPLEVRQHVTAVAKQMRPGRRNELTFQLYRRLLTTPLGRRPLVDHYPMFQVFFAACRGRQRTEDFRECWSDYCRSADYCRSLWAPSTAGGPLERAIEAANRIPIELLPKIHRAREPTRRLAAACDMLGRTGQRFGLPQVALANILGVTQQAVSKKIRTLLSSGFIRLVREPVWSGDGLGRYALYGLSLLPSYQTQLNNK